MSRRRSAAQARRAAAERSGRENRPIRTTIPPSADPTHAVPVAPARRARLPYFGAIDGLRAMSVLAVLFYHADAPWLPGGFLGVDVFFVISGYLITSLLVNEWQGNRRISLGRFWSRRARRLLPEVVAVLLGVLIWAAFFHPDELAGLRADALAAAGYVMNWRLIFGHQSYFDSWGRPPVLRHLWSLAVEEQFYLAWPLVAAVVLWLTRRRGALLSIAIGGALASALLMAALYRGPDFDASRVYYGTDTRASAVLIGSALALCWTPWTSARHEPAGRATRIVANSIALAALGSLIVCFATLRDTSPLLYRGGFLGVAALSAVAVGAAVHSAPTWVNLLLGSRVMRWLGQRSYGIYLWHWPLFAYTRPGDDVPLDGWQLAVVRFAATLLLAEFSFRFVAGPVRAGALGRAWGILRKPRTPREWSFRPAAAMAALALAGGIAFVVTANSSNASVSLPTSFTGVVTPVSTEPVEPTPTASRNLSSLPTRDLSTAVPTESPPDEPSPAATPTSGATGTPTQGTAAPLPLLPPARVTADVLAIGDSVMLGAAPALGQAGTVQVDAAVGRQASALPGIIEGYRALGPLPPVLVIHVGTNGTFRRTDFDRIVAAAQGVGQIVFVNVHVDRSWESGNNAMLATAVNAYPNTTLVDWHQAAEGHDELFGADGVHLTAQGADLYARLIAAAIHPAPPPETPTPTPSPSPSPSSNPSPSPSPFPSESTTPNPTSTGTTVTASPIPSGTGTGSETPTPTSTVTPAPVQR